MAKVLAGRYAAQIKGPFVVFLIVNRLWALTKWIPVARAMPPMINDLMANRESGLLHAEIAVTWRGLATIQYWQSFEQLNAYAHARDAKHLPAWAAFDRSVGANGSVGVWHETYQVAVGGYECVYVNMPRWGLASAGEHVEAVGRMKDAKSRMGGTAGTDVR
jgi:hypothetical protein